VVRVAQVAGEGALEVLEVAVQRAARLEMARAGACRLAICPTSAVNASRSGMLKSRSRQVGTLPPTRA
jgi:hypothetical protein